MVTKCNQQQLSILSACDKKTPKFNFDGMHVQAKCVSVYDGDTATFAFFPHPTSAPKTISCRFLGFNSAEIRTKDAQEKQKAIAAREYLRGLILDKIVILKISKNDKYGRPLVDVFINNIHINSEMVRNGHGKPYDGTGPKEY